MDTDTMLDLDSFHLERKQKSGKDPRLPQGTHCQKAPLTSADWECKCLFEVSDVGGRHEFGRLAQQSCRGHTSIDPVLTIVIPIRPSLHWLYDDSRYRGHTI